MADASSFFQKVKIDVLDKIFYLFCFGLFFLLNLLTYESVLYLQKRQDSLLLNTYTNSINKIAATDIKLLAQNNFANTSGSLLEAHISCSISNLKSALSDLLPSYFSYHIIIDNEIIGSNKISNAVQNIDNFHVIKHGNIKIQLWLNKQLPDYLALLYNVGSILLVSMSLSFSLLSLLILLYRTKSNRFLMQLNDIKQQLAKASEINKKLVSGMELNKKLQRSFMQKATDIYIAEGLKNIQWENNQPLQELRKSSIFPFILSDSKPSVLEINELTTDIEQFFSSPIFYSNLQIVNSCTSAILISCAKEVIYQIIFSLIFNVIKFMDDQSNTSQTLKINITQDNITLEHKGYPLNEETMINLSETIQEVHKDVFILTCKKLFKSIKEHGIKYTIGCKNGENKVVLYFNMPQGDNQTGKVIEFKSK